MRDHIGVEYDIGKNLINKETWGNIYKPKKEKYNSIIKYRSSRFT